MRPTEIIHKVLIDEVVRLYKINRDWLRVIPDDTGFGYTVQAAGTYGSWLLHYPSSALERVEMLLFSRYYGDGPKCFVPTVQQCEALEQVEVNLQVNDYTQPYDVVAVKLPDGRYRNYKYAMVMRLPGPPVVIITSLTAGRPTGVDPSQWEPNMAHAFYGNHKEDIEFYLHRYDKDCTEEEQAIALRALRVALNSCLALCNFGCQASLMYPKEVARDQGLARERSERGERARQRVALAVQQLTFSQEVKLYHKEGGHPTGQPTGASMPCHWRRGHWAMTPCGPKHSERRRVFRAPVLVRADLLAGDKANTSVTYRG